MAIKVTLPLKREIAAGLCAGDRVELSGVVYAARDAAHQRLLELLDAGRPLPFEISGATIYYMGPSPEAPGQVIGAAGPTTSSRMDRFTPRLIELGLMGMIGKGKRSPAVLQSMQAHGAVYFAAVGGAGALLARAIRSQKVIAFDDLGPEAIRELVVADFPVIVAADVYGGNLYESEREKYRIS